MTIRRPPGFTLIELLVVVGIIAILAAIAVPSLLTAQTRAKVSRAKSDLRTLATALEAYITDNGLPPLDYKVSRGDPMGPEMQPSTSGILHPGAVTANGRVAPGLTTPIAYIQNCWIDDPFGNSNVPFDQRKYTYNWFAPDPLRNVPVNTDYRFQEYDRFYGYWRLGSIGPDRDFYNKANTPYSPSRVYDPTNGAASAGNIWRSHREGSVAQRPPLDVIIDPE
ncbi:hypothetical protein BH09SUM1_BH09SUM1_31250 [soil metagenome]